MMTSSKFVTTFVHLGEVEDLQEADFESIEKFTCRLYGSSQENINNVRYKIYCSKQGKISLASLPPCRHTLKKHCQRANYQTRIWRRCLEQNYLIANPTDHGWIDDDDGNLIVHWMDCEPAPDSVCIFTYGFIFIMWHILTYSIEKVCMEVILHIESRNLGLPRKPRFTNP